MKILLLRERNPFYESNASGNRFAGLIKGLLMNNIDVDILITDGYGSKQEVEESKKNNIFGLRFIYTRKYIHGSYWMDRINLYVLNGFWDRYNERIIKQYFQKDYDYVWVRNKYSVLRAFNNNRAKIKGKTLIELNEFNDLYLQDDTMTFLQKQKMKATDIQIRKALKGLDCLAVMTQTLLDHYKKISSDNVKCLHLPMTVDIGRFYNVGDCEDYKKPYIAFTGTYTNAKDGVDVLIKAFGKVASKYPTYHLYLAGFWHYDVDGQKQLIKNLKIEDRVTYLGALSKAQIPSFICNADLLALSRPDSHQAQGGFPTKLGEYLATGRPVCVTKVGEIPQYLTDDVSAFMAEPGSVDSFANAMDRALRNSDNAHQIGKCGKAVAETNFSIDVQAKRLALFLKENR